MSPAELVFPPPPTRGLRQRPALAELERGRRSLSVVHPSSDSFVVVGQRFTIDFNEAVVGATPGAPAGDLLSISPSVPGQLRWLGPKSLEFVAATAFDPEQTYQLNLSGVSAIRERERKLSWRASFTASGPRLAGKALGYLPVPGDARAVSLSVHDGQLVAPRQSFLVLYDQPVTREFARERIELTRANGALLPVNLERPHINRFDGVTVPSGQLVVVRPRAPVARGERLMLRAYDERPGRDRRGRTASVQVAPKLAHEAVVCDFSGTACDEMDGIYVLDERQLHLEFNHALAESSTELQHRLRISPRPNHLNLSVNTWSGRGHVIVSGDFRPGEIYRVSLSGLTDPYGDRLTQPISLRVRQRPLSASLSMPEGALWLDEEHTQSFEFTSRNVSRAQLWIWQIPDGSGEALQQALTAAGDSRQGPAFLVLPIDVEPRLDEFVTTTVDLRRALRPHQSYLVELRHDQTAFQAKTPRYAPTSAATHPPTALITPSGRDGLELHVHNSPDASLVLVTRADTGQPVSRALVSWAGTRTEVTTDSSGVARLPAMADPSALVRVESAGQTLLMAAHHEQSDAAHMFPELAGRETPTRALRVFVQTDRDIYRPGETLHLKASAFERTSDGVAPARQEKLELTLRAPDGRELVHSAKRTNDFGSAVLDHAFDKKARLGQYVIEVRANKQTLLEQSVRLAAFEAPRFALDLELPASVEGTRLNGEISGHYLFGAPLRGATVSWSLKAEPAELEGPLASAGLSFSPWDESFTTTRAGENWNRAGVGTLDEAGRLALGLELPTAGARGPLRLTLQAEASDESNRFSAQRGSVLYHPAPRYAGLSLERSWFNEGQAIDVALGVADQRGEPIVGARVEARLERVEYRLSKRRTQAGALDYRWTPRRRPAGSCHTKSEAEPAHCALTPRVAGNYLVSAWVDGRPGGQRSLWVYGHGPQAADARPHGPGRVTVVADQAAYQPGQTAHLLIDNPLPSATALVTLESDRLWTHRTLTMGAGLATVDLPIEAKHAPFVHATVTLLGRGNQREPQAPLTGAVRLPVSLADVRLGLKVAAGKPVYRPGERASVTLDVTHAGRPATNVEVAVAVVDEGVLRLTGFHAPDPLATLWQGSPLAFSFSDTRSGLAEWYDRSHIAGDGDAEGGLAPLLTRTRFVNTPLWQPQIHPDAQGHARVEFELPHNLTEFRILAVAVDRQGRSGTNESSFRVSKPVLLEPVLPRFAKQGDRFELAALIHNTSRAWFRGSVKVAGKNRVVAVAPGARQRVADEFEPSRSGTLSLGFGLYDQTGRALDEVSRPLQVTAAGVAVEPRLMGSFRDRQEIALNIPDQVNAAEDATLDITVGANLHPELGAELEFLLGYPHGCVEQTTSSTLPLLAARKILPLIGITKYTDEFFDARIRHGLKRLASMRTADGGLAYWPGGNSSSAFGTAYAMRAVVSARQAGIDLPPGMNEGMLDYLHQRLLDSQVVPEVRSAIALSLAESRELALQDSDALFDMEGELGVFGKANLALALSVLESQKDRVRTLLDEVEAALRTGGPFARDNREDLHSFSSETRALAQASVALNRLRPRSSELPRGIATLLISNEGYTTQATAYRLLALAEHVEAARTHAAVPEARLDGQLLTVARELPSGLREYRIPLSELKGRSRRLELSADRDSPLSFSLDAAYTLPPTESSATAASGANGPDLYRVFTTPDGHPVDLSALRAGQLLRVALLARKPSSLAQRDFRYLAISDALPAGFEPVDPSLDTIAEVRDVTDAHPLFGWLARSYARPDHIELGDDKVRIYYDKPGAPDVAVSYLVRATTPGTFSLPRPSAELMYQPDGTSFGGFAQVVIQ